MKWLKWLLIGYAIAAILLYLAKYPKPTLYGTIMGPFWKAVDIGKRVIT